MRKNLTMQLAGVIAALLVAATPASAAVVINEVESDGGTGVADWIELANTGAAPADVSGYVLKDSEDKRKLALPAGTTIAPGGFLDVTVDGVKDGFGLGSEDQIRVYNGATLVDSFTWTRHAAATEGLCAGTMHWTSAATRGAANSCPGAAPAWPGSADTANVDDADVFGKNLSGLAYQDGVLWAVRNGPSTLFRLVRNGTKWTPDTANGWANGKQLFFADGAGVPDAEGVTLVNGEVYVSIERNDDGPNSLTSRPSVLRYDVSAPGATLKAADEWNLVADMPGLDANSGLEALTWVPDEVLVAKGLRDEAKGGAYNPANYAGHGTGLFLAGVEENAMIHAYALDRTTGKATRIASFASGFPKLMELTFEPETGKVWAVCDDSCGGRTATLDIGQDGRFAVSSYYERPAASPNLNHEGFAIAPQSECAGGLKPVFYTDDSNIGSHALRMGKIKCTAPKAPEPKSEPTVTPEPNVKPKVLPQPGPQADRTAPQLKVAVKLGKTIRRNGAFTATVTLDERAGLTITAKGRKAKLSATRPNVAAGKTTLKLTLSRTARAALRKGEKLTIAVQARDAAGNVTAARASAKVR